MFRKPGRSEVRNKSIGKMLVLSVLVYISGCASFEAKPLSPVDTTKAFEARTLDSAGLREFVQQNLKREMAPWPPESWDFQMLTLAALYYHPDMDVARAQWGIAEAGVITAGGRPNPVAGISPGYDFNPPGGISPWILSFSFDVPLETAGKRGYRIARARHLSEAARLNIAATAWQVQSRLRTRLLNLYAAERSEDILGKRSADLKDLVTAEEHLFAAGEVSRFEVTQARISLDETSLSLKEAQKQRAESQAGLADALGLPPSAIEGANVSFDLFDQLPPMEDWPVDKLTRTALSGRADILGMLAEYAAAESALQLEIARQYPDIRIGPGYTWDEGENKWFLGISFPLPVFNRNQGPIAEAEARRKETTARFISLQARIIGEVGRTLAGYDIALQKLMTADALLENKKKTLQSMQQMFQAGEVGRPDLLNARLEYSLAELSRLKALIEAQQSLGTLENAVQRPLMPSQEPSPAAPDASPRVKEDVSK
jgi:cobalt-zinc-cadmium efflux system outer membrane protein